MLMRAISCCLFAAIALARPGNAQNSRYEFSLDGAQQVPPVTSSAVAHAAVSVDAANSRIDVYVSFADLSGAIVAARIHQGAAGTNGPVLATLNPTPDATGVIADTGLALSASAISAITNGGAYLSLSSPRYPAGEIRGQIVHRPTCDRVLWASPFSATFGKVRNTALGQARLQSVGQCELMVTNAGSNGQSGVRLDNFPANTRMTVGLFSCPNMANSRQGSKFTMLARDSANTVMSSTTIENIDGRNVQVDFDWSYLGVTSYTVELWYRGRVVGRFAALPQASLRHAAGDWEEVN